MMNEEIYQATISTCSEAMLYFIINDLGGFIFNTLHYMRRRPGSEPDAATFKTLAAARDQIQRAVAQTVRFGVEQPFRDPEAKMASAEYWLWFRWWDLWSKALTDKEFVAMDIAMAEGQDIRPAGDWREVAAEVAL